MNLLQKYLSTEQNKKHRNPTDSGEKRSQNTGFPRKDVSVLLPERLWFAPLPLRHPRRADFSRLLSVSSLRLATPESITPLERPWPYLLLISFSFIQFNRSIIHLLCANVKSLFLQILIFFGRKILPPRLARRARVCYNIKERNFGGRNAGQGRDF